MACRREYCLLDRYQSFLIDRLDVSDGSVRTWYFDELVTAIVCTDRLEILLVVFGSKVCLWSPWENRIVREICRLEQWPAVRSDDARADSRGSLWAGTMANNVASDGSNREVKGSVRVIYRIDPDGGARLWKEGIGISNTVVWRVSIHSSRHPKSHIASQDKNDIWTGSCEPRPTRRAERSRWPLWLHSGNCRCAIS